MVLVGDEAQAEAYFGPFGGGANLDARLAHGLHQTFRRIENHFGRTRRYSLVTWVKWNLVSVCWELVSVQDSCTVGAEHTIGSEIVLDTPDGTPR